MQFRIDEDVPVIGVAKSGWTVEQLRERARDSITKYGGGVDDEAFARLCELLDYLDGDYKDDRTYAALRAKLGDAGVAVSDIHEESYSLEDVFIAVVEKARQEGKFASED